MNSTTLRLVPLVIAAAIGGGCGGGSGGSSTVRQAEQATTPPTRSVAEHSAQRSALAPLPGATTAQRAVVLAATQEMALAQLREEMPIAAQTAMAVPSLVFGHVSVMRQAAAGTTLAELDQRFPMVGDATTTALLTAPLSRQMVGAATRRPLVSFLEASDGSALPTWLAAWSGSDADFTASASWAALPAGAPDLPADRSNLRLAVLDRLDLKLAWPAQPVEDGVFADERGGRSKMSFIRLRQGVQSAAGGNYRADFLRQGSRTLVMIRPGAAVTSFIDWLRHADNGLDRALRETAQAVASSAAGGSGELLLPVGNVAPPAPVTTIMARRGVTLPYSQVQANFKGLDGGGTYAVSNGWRASGAANEVSPTTSLVFRADGADVLAQHLTSFVFSPLNVNGPDFYGVRAVSFNPTFTTCPHAGVDLSRYVLAQRHDTLGWLWVATFTQAPGAVPCFDF